MPASGAAATSVTPVDQKALHRALDTLTFAAETSLRPDGNKERGYLTNRDTVLYNSTLAKYGIMTQTRPKENPMDKAGPALKSYLERQKRIKAELLAGMPPSELTSAPYRPHSTEDFMKRLSTFKLSTYRDRPSVIDAVNAARCGWINSGKDRLVCELCGAAWIMASWTGLNKEAADSLINRHAAALVDSHKEFCPWRTRQCETSIYRMPLNTRVGLARDIVERATALTAVLDDLDITHPLSSSELSTVLSTLRTVKPAAKEFSPRAPSSSPSGDGEPPNFSDSAAITALFGWAVSSLESAHGSSPSHDHSLSRSSSVAPFGDGMPTTPARSGTSSPLFRSPSSPFTTPSRPPAGVSGSSAKLLQCTLCYARVGLWVFAKTRAADGMDVDQSPSVRRSSVGRTRTFDVLKEHRSFCPYTTRTTPTTEFTLTLRPPPKGTPVATVEGWRAIVHILTRPTASQRKMTGGSLHDSNAQVPGAVMDDIEAAMEHVSKNGGKDLVRYVNNLFK